MTIRLEGKRPDEARTYRHDWSPWLGVDTISTSDFDSDDVTIDFDSNDTTSVTFSISGGTTGTRARITNTITTAAGDEETEVFTLLISDADEPLTTDEAKAHLRVTDDSEDALIYSYIQAARQWVENYTGHILVQRTVVDAFSAWGNFLTLRNQPITVGDPTPTLTVDYIDSDGNEVEYTGRVIRDQRYPWMVFPANGSTFPTLGTNGTITVTYTAGYTEGSVPQPLVQAMLLLIGHWFSMRSSVSEVPLQEAPLAVTSLCRPFRGAVLA